jgi:hypothetical protein
MKIAKYINIPVFLLSLVVGLFMVYMTMPDMRKIYVYPNPENIDILQYRDKTDGCFAYKQERVNCPKDETKISKIPVQS